jgi:hypothetical protein
MALLTLLGVSTFALSNKPAKAQSSSESCYSAQSFIKNTVRKNDLRSRVDRLQVYEYMYDNLNSISIRLAINKQPGSQQMAKLIKELRVKIDKFISDYEKYDQSRDTLTNLSDCSKNTKEFEALLSRTRNDRARVALDVKKVESSFSGPALTRLEDLKTQFLEPEKAQQ